jgi:hypothetical protein
VRLIQQVCTRQHALPLCLFDEYLVHQCGEYYEDQGRGEARLPRDGINVAGFSLLS